MNLINKLSTGLLSTTFFLFYNQAVQAQSLEDEIKSKAQVITVEVVSLSVTGSSETVPAGSGVLIGKEGNRYYVVTNEHVVAVDDDYLVIINPENIFAIPEQYNVLVEEKLPRPIDLALITFESTNGQNYEIAKIANPNNLSKDEPIYVSGFPSAANSQEKFKFVPAKVINQKFIEQPPRDYKPLTYAPRLVGSYLEKGMSGGSILTSKGELIGIHQQSGDDEKICRNICIGIPIEVIQNKLALQQSPEDETANNSSIEEEDNQLEESKNTITGYTGISLGGFFPDHDLLDTGFGGSIVFGGKFTKNFGADLEFALLGGGTEFDGVDYTAWNLSINPKFFIPLTKKDNAPYLFLSPGFGISQADVDGVGVLEEDTRFTWQAKLGFGLPINKHYEGFAQVRYTSQTGENSLDYFASEVGIAVDF